MAEEHGTELELVTKCAAAKRNTRGSVPASSDSRSSSHGCCGTTDALLVAPDICRHADVRLAHEQMQVHLTCRIERCAWKAAAYRTLVSTGRLTPQAVTHRERAAARGMRFPSYDEPDIAHHDLDVPTLQKVLEGLSALTGSTEPLRG
ncbi:hypothetical protein [Nocardia abscessus]|uniref:hypothetical protein n=2 Tax=Nocardia abscessus TaxID=120957 RepID=UPI0024559C3F|nr:hypothetical protein [Nocardia abscessus]